MAVLRNESQMFPLVETWLQSGLTQEEFSSTHGMSKHVLSYWVCKYRKSQRFAKQQSETATPSFIQVQAPATVASSSMEIILPTGVMIRFADQIPVSYLQQVLKVCSV